MRQSSIEYLASLGIIVTNGMYVGVMLSEDEDRYLNGGYDFNAGLNSPGNKRRYNEIAVRNGLPPAPPGFRYGSGASRMLNIFETEIFT